MFGNRRIRRARIPIPAARYFFVLSRDTGPRRRTGRFTRAPHSTERVGRSVQESCILAVEIRLFDQLDEVGKDGGDALGRETRASLCDRLDWFRLVTRYTP